MALVLDTDIAVNSRSFGNFTRTTECESYVQALMTDEEDHREAVTYPRSQNMSGGKGGPRPLEHVSSFLGCPCTVE